MPSNEEVKCIYIREYKIWKWLNLTHSSSKTTSVNQSKNVLICKVFIELLHRLVEKTFINFCIKNLLFFSLHIHFSKYSTSEYLFSLIIFCFIVKPRWIMLSIFKPSWLYWLSIPYMLKNQSALKGETLLYVEGGAVLMWLSC